MAQRLFVYDTAAPAHVSRSAIQSYRSTAKLLSPVCVLVGCREITQKEWEGTITAAGVGKSMYSTHYSCFPIIGGSGGCCCCMGRHGNDIVICYNAAQEQHGSLWEPAVGLGPSG